MVIIPIGGYILREIVHFDATGRTRTAAVNNDTISGKFLTQFQNIIKIIKS